MANKNKESAQKLLNGKPATQKNVTLENEYFARIIDGGYLKYDSFSTFVRKLIDKELSQPA